VLAIVEMNLMNRICVLLVSCLITACSQSTLVQAKPSGPVDIEYTVPKNVAIGEVVTTILRFKAKTYLQQLVVSASPDRGLTLDSGVDKQVFTNIETGAMREVEISIILNDSKGYVTVAAETTDANGRIRHKNKMIKFNSNKIDTSRSKTVDYNTGEKLILMPAEAEQ
jgi:hypothetical protein